MGDAPGMLVVGYGADGRVCGVAVNPRHRSLSWLKMWELVELAAELGTTRVAIAVHAAGRDPRPSSHERAVFRDVRARARRAGITVVDAVVWRGGRWWSLGDEPGAGAPVDRSRGTARAHRASSADRRRRQSRPGRSDL